MACSTLKWLSHKSDLVILSWLPEGNNPLPQLYILVSEPQVCQSLPGEWRHATDNSHIALYHKDLPISDLLLTRSSDPRRDSSICVRNGATECDVLLKLAWIYFFQTPYDIMYLKQKLMRYKIIPFSKLLIYINVKVNVC